eukprot:gene26389-32963_t
MERVRCLTPPLSPHTEIARRMTYYRQQAVRYSHWASAPSSPHQTESLMTASSMRRVNSGGFPPRATTNRCRANLLTDEKLAVALAPLSLPSECEANENCSATTSLDCTSNDEVFDNFDFYPETKSSSVTTSSTTSQKEKESSLALAFAAANAAAERAAM